MLVIKKYKKPTVTVLLYVFFFLNTTDTYILYYFYEILRYVLNYNLDTKSNLKLDLYVFLKES